MKRVRRFGAVLLAVAPLALVSAAQAVNGHANYHAVCPAAESGAARCHAQIVSDERGNPDATVAPAGYGPAQFHGAYGLPATTGSLRTIAIVDAYDNPT